MSAHAAAFNLARRNTERFENDLLQTNMLEDKEDKYTEKFCSSLLNKMVSYNFELPTQCAKFSNVKDRFQQMKLEAKEENAVAFVGMSPGEARDAQVARQQGRSTHAQIKRRMTTRSKQSQSSWF